MQWLQEIGNWDIVSDGIMGGTVDKIGPVIIGAVDHQALLKNSHTIAMWWPKTRFDKNIADVLQEVMRLDRPGYQRGAVLWTTNPKHKLVIESPLVVEERHTEDVLYYLHVLYYIVQMNISRKEYLSLKINRKLFLLDVLSNSSPRYLSSLKEANIYRYYSRELDRHDKEQVR
jgi:hypothetical protein